MDTASRMKRAQEMGFDTGRPLYHGTFQDFDAFDANAPRAFRRKENNSPQVHTTTSATEAEKYGDKIMPLYARGRFVDIESPMKMQDNVISRLKQIEEKIDRDFYKKSQIELDGGEPNYRYNYDTLDRIRKYLYGAEITDNFGDSIAHARMKAEISKAKRAGADGVRIRGGWGDEGAGEHYVVFDPKNLRSQFAAFDPAKKDSPNLLASNPKESAFLSALAGEQMQQPGITAYHGSPHSFDKFSMDKIGTGEGAQAYGHGLYMAENEAVARQYRDALSDVTVNGKEPDWKNPDHWMATALHTAKGDRSAAISEIARNLESQFPDNRPAMRKAIADLESGNVPNNLPAVTGGGHMYEVRINADPEHFLDWDKPLSQQSEKVQGALSKFDRDMYHPEGPDYDPMEPGHIAYQRLAERLSKSIPADADAGWSSVVNTINDKVQNRGSATDFLRDNGVPGIRYLDQGSRTAGEGSRNFVVFDDKLISIVRKYGWAGAAAMLGMSTDDLMSQAQAQQSPGVPASNPLYR